MSRGRSRSRDNGNGFEGWGGYMNAKRQKLQEQFEQEVPGKLQKEDSGSKIFAGIRIHVDGYTKPSSDELKRLMMIHGGGYEHYLYRTRVTHVIATNLPNSKVKELKGLKVVSPEWITDSIAAGKLLSYTKYQLYTAQSGLQKGLQSYTISRENSDHSEGNLQSINSTNVTSASISGFPDSKNNPECNSLAEITAEEEEDFDEVKNKHADVPQAERKKETSPLKRQVSPNSSSVSPAKAGDPRFLNEFYSHSRLHYLSTWKSEWKNYVNELQTKGDNFPGRERLRKVVNERGVTSDVGRETTGKLRRCVMHIDMDCFFVSVGLRNRPDLRGKPVAVTHSRGKGATVDPESDLNFEKQQWQQKKLQGRKKGREQKTDNSTLNEDFSFPDLSESDSEEDLTGDVIGAAKATTESFHSMAEIASCSYEARQAGVRNGMFMGQAKRICPDLVTIPYDFDGYKAVSKILYDTVASYTHDIEAVSCDEMLVDCTDLLADTGATPLEFSSILRAELFEKTGCPASAGLGSNILLARMATHKAKPNGQFLLTEDLVGEYIKSKPVKDIPGVGWSLSKRLEAMKVSTCGDLQRHSLESLQKEFGAKTGQSLYKYCRGQDDRSIKVEQQRKSVSAEVNYGIRFASDIEAVRFMEELSEEVCNRLKSIKMKGKTVTLKIMVRREDAPRQTSKFMGHGICNNFSKSVTLPMATDNAKIVARETINLLRQHKVPPEDLRGIGIQVQKLESAELGTRGGNKMLPSIMNYTVAKPAKDNKPSLTSTNCSLVKPSAPPGGKGGSSSKELAPPGGKGISSSKESAPPGGKGSSSSKESAPPGGKGSSASKESAPPGGKGSSLSTESAPPGGKGSLASKESAPSDGNKEPAPPGGKGSSPCIVDISTRNESLVTHQEDVEMLDHSAGDDDLLEDLGRRQTSGVALPPLPCLPDIKTPESTKKLRPSVTMEAVAPDVSETDYFPSPSQVDPEVLQELPPEIRQQIETELQKRRKHPIKRQLQTDVNAPGCSYWQPEKAGDSPATEIRNEADKHINDAIVALPSPSQLDPSCLEALPESLQAELRQAYARQGSRPSSTRATHMLQLQQAQSPAKSPNKRSPGKRSPNFKVPRGRPSGRGNRRGSSKKTLFKDQARTLQQQQKHSAAVRMDPPEMPDVMVNVSVINQRHSEADNQSAGNQSGDMPSAQSVSVHEPVSDQENVSGVNLCGAVELKDVRLLLAEWITSTTDPQVDDEEIMMRYLEDLILDKNLEQVDLVLKFMFRSINRLKSSEWLASLRRIFNKTQQVVYHLYGSRLASINL